jgi:hypothetical protein
MITHLIALVVGFIAGALVFRNNAKKAEAIVQKSEAVVDKAGIAVKSFKK